MRADTISTTLSPSQGDMGLSDRIQLYEKVEKIRGKPLIAYITSTRYNAPGQIGQDTISELLTQLQTLPRDTTDLDLLLVSNGGDGTVAWRVVSLIRERVKKFSILIPHSAFSAATLIALGANEIVMHPHGNLGPTDPQVTNPLKGIQFGTEDLQAFLRFAREQVGLTRQEPLRDVFLKFSEEVGFVSVGTAARSTQLSATIGEKMLLMHMTKKAEKQKARTISHSLNTKYFHHGYPLSRTEAKEIGLSVAKPDIAVEDLMWSIWKDLEAELCLREAFVPLDLVKDNPNCRALFGPNPQPVPTTEYEYTAALMESIRHGSRFRVAGRIFASPLPNLEIKIQMAPEKIGWVDVALPVPAPAPTPEAADTSPLTPVPDPAPAPGPTGPGTS
ncbi:MAG TPA: hypothetical protein VGF53_08025 [Pseudolabrys sp.]